jgi:ketosteroid isomerase-like protein
MMRSLLSYALFTALFTSCTTTTPTPASIPDAHSAIRARYFSLDTLFAQDSMAAIANMYLDSAVVVSHGQEIKGRAAVADYWSMLKGRGVSWDHRIERLDVRGDRAIQTGTSDLRYTRGEDTLISFTRYTLIWAQDSNGQWWIDRDHYSAAQRVVYE